ncbi:hypothetical protein [Chryseobacterium sp.]|uniref:hypothetical protein n=1 Tax=Chryseobacterium sp. TaxID=1871047 RepID=UPI003219CA7A
MKNIAYLFSIISFSLCVQNCNKIKNKVKEKMHVPDYSYKNEGIDNFYYSHSEVGNTPVIPLVKPYNISNIGSPREWYLDTYTAKLNNELGGGISPIESFNCKDNYIYGYKPFEEDKEDPKFNSPEKWFIIDVQEKKLIYFDKKVSFIKAIKELNLPETFLNPDEVYEQYTKDPVLPWFPENIKKQLEKVKK